MSRPEWWRDPEPTDPQQDYPPPLRKPACPPMDDPKSSQVNGT